MYDWELTDLEIFRLKRNYEKDPIFTKALLVSKELTLDDLFVRVLRKYYRSTSLCKEKDVTKHKMDFYYELW